MGDSPTNMPTSNPTRNPTASPTSDCQSSFLSYNGKCYGTVDWDLKPEPVRFDTPVSSSADNCDIEEWHEIPDGCNLAPAQGDITQNVVGKYEFGTYLLILANGGAYQNPTYGATAGQRHLSHNFLQMGPTARHYKTKCCGCKLLLQCDLGFGIETNPTANPPANPIVAPDTTCHICPSGTIQYPGTHRCFARKWSGFLCNLDPATDPAKHHANDPKCVCSVTLKVSESSNWSRRYNQRLERGWYCSGSKQENWGGLPNEQVVRYGSLDLEVLDAQKQTYRVVSQENEHGIDFGKGLDCYAWAHCGAQTKRGGFSIDLRGTGFEIVSSRVVSSGWGNSMYVSQDGAPHEKSSNFALADGTQRVEATCGGWCGSCQAELVVRKIPSTWRVSLDGRDLAPGQWTGDGGISYENCVKRAEAQMVKYFAWTGEVYQPGYCKVLKPGIANPNLSTFQGYGYKLFENVDESCRWVVSSQGRDLQRGQWDGYGYTNYNNCVAKADAQGVKFFAWTASVYGGYCKVLKREVTNPNMNTYQGYNYKLYERKCSTRRM